MRTLPEIAKDILTQDNRATAKPVIFLLQIKKWFYANDPDFGGEEVFQITDDDSYEIYTSLVDLQKAWNEWHGLEKKFNHKTSYRRLYRKHYWETENVFFTEKGYEEHKRLNGHNLGEHRTYVIHAWRNPEMKTIMDLILNAAESEVKNG